MEPNPKDGGAVRGIGGTGGAPRVLVVEDDEAVAATLRAVLAGAGYRVDAAADFREAAGRLAASRYDAVLLDLRLGSDDGLDVLERLRAISPGTVAIILTGFVSRENAIRALRLGAADFFAKPADPPALLTALDRALKRREAEREALARDARGRSEALAREQASRRVAERLGTEAEEARHGAERTVARADHLLTITGALSRALTPDDVADAILTAVISALGARAGSLLALSADGSDLIAIAEASDPPGAPTPRSVPSPPDRVPVESVTPVGGAVRTGEPVVLAGVAQRASRSANPAPAAMADHGTVVAIPLLLDRRALGAILLSFAAPRAFDGEDLGLLRAIGQQCALAYERARLYDAQQRAQRRAEALAETARLLAEAGADVRAVLDTTTRRVAELIGDGGLLALRGEDGPVLDVTALHHPDPATRDRAWDAVRRAPLRADEGLAARVLSGGEPVTLAELPPGVAWGPVPSGRRGDEGAGPASLAIVPLRARGRVIGLLGVWRDRPGRPYHPDDAGLLRDLADHAALAIEHARLYQEARAAGRRRDEFLTVAAHELKTPITGILGNIQLVLRRLRGDAAPDLAWLGARLTSVERQTRHLADLADRLLEVTILEAGTLAVDPTPTDLAALVQAVAETARARTTKHALRARTVGPVVASVDPIRISQVVAHLVDNAIRFSPDGGPIELDLTASSPDAALLRVTDHGIGIPVADRVHLFERFAPTRHAGYLSGIGLGLYVCRRICELHGGSLHAEFPDQGGTCFVITLPRSGGTERP